MNFYLLKKINQGTKGSQDRIRTPATDSACITDEFCNPVNVDGIQRLE